LLWYCSLRKRYYFSKEKTLKKDVFSSIWGKKHPASS
jgi:hypothetical protein